MPPSFLALLLLALAGQAEQPPPAAAPAAAIPVWDRLPERWNGALKAIPRAPGQKGLWMGAVPLCRGTVATVQSTSRYKGDVAMVLALREEMRGRIEVETTRYERRPLPIRVDGRAIAAPVVEMPITGGAVELHLDSRAVARRLQAAARAPCRAGALDR